MSQGPDGWQRELARNRDQLSENDPTLRDPSDDSGAGLDTAPSRVEVIYNID